MKKKTNEKQALADTKPETANQKSVSPEAVEKEFADIINYQRKQRDNLLGNFVQGEYTISKQLQEELLKVPKKFGEIEGNVARLATILGKYVLNFKVVFSIDPDICNAKLYIIEIEHDLDEDIKHETLLDEVEQPFNFDFRKDVFGKWKVFYDENDLTKDELLYSYLHMQEEENLFFGDLDGILSQLFVVRLLAYLDKMGELGEKIRVDFKLAMEKYLKLDPKYALNYVFQKRLLAKFIAKHNALPVIAKEQEGAMILQGYSTPLRNVRDKSYAPIVEQKRQEKKEVKKEEKKSQPTVKRKSGSPAKKADGKVFKFDPSKVPKLGIEAVGMTPMPQIPVPTPPIVEIPAAPATTPQNAPIVEPPVPEEDALDELDEEDFSEVAQLASMVNSTNNELSGLTEVADTSEVLSNSLNDMGSLADNANVMNDEQTDIATMAAMDIHK